MPDLILPSSLDKDTVRILTKWGHDADRCVQAYFRIKNKSGQLIDFRFNRAQRLVVERAAAFRKVLKPRKVGISSWRIPRDLWICATRRSEHRICLTHTGEAAEKILAERVKPFVDHCKFPIGAVQRSWGYDFPLTGSRYYVGTAGSRKFGRGDDITGRHFMETAHWDTPEVITGVDEALVDFADGLDETTANGYNFWKKDWEAAKRGESRDRAIFLPWFAHEEYALAGVAVGPLSEEERRLIDAFQLIEAQIAWRREKIKSMRDPALFPQEYPETDEQAFLSAGRPVFDHIALEKHRRVSIMPPKLRGYLRQDSERVVFIPDPHGPLRVWKTPEHGHVYAAGSDVAEGVEGGAYSTAEVLDLGDSEQVAEWHGHIDPDLMGDVLDLIAAWYNNAVLIPEAWPGPGEVTVTRIISNGRSRVWEGHDEKRPGWHTSERTKTLMAGSLGQGLRDFHVTIRSQELLEELHAFVYDERGHMVPSLGNFSDRVMGFGIVWAATRDMAARVDYYRSRTPMAQALGQSLKISGGTSVPQWKGPRPGVRSE